jgi:hypothetical protein
MDDERDCSDDCESSGGMCEASPGMMPKGIRPATASETLREIIVSAKTRLRELEALQKVVDHAEPGTPLEKILREAVRSINRRPC